MKKLIALFLITGVLLMAGSRAYAADDTLGATITGSEVHTMSISGGTSLSYQDPGNMGPQNYTLTGGTTTLTLNDNSVADYTDDSLVVYATLSPTPEWYGSGAFGDEDDIYYIKAENVAWTPAADNTITTGLVAGDVPISSGGIFDGILFGAYAGTTGGVLSGDIDMDLKLVVLADKRVFGNESQSYTITFTFYEH